MKPVLLVIAGPNGSGKTTVTRILRRDRWSEGVEYINPDEIAQSRFGDWNSPQAVLQAARWAEARRTELLNQRQGIAFETVFSASDKIDFLQHAKEAGYFIRFFFVGTSDPIINAARIAQRVAGGGHTVPIDKIISRYEKSMVNLIAAMVLADRAYIYDNSVEEQDAVLYARTQDGALRKIYDSPPRWINAAVNFIPKHSEFEDLSRGTP